MPTVREEEITDLNALFTAMVKAAIEIKHQEPKLKAVCEQIEKDGHDGKLKLSEILAR